MPIISIILFIVVGAAVGYIATTALKVKAGIPATIGIGMAGVAIGYFLFRVVGVIFSVFGGILSSILGGLIGALLIVYIYKTFYLK